MARWQLATAAALLLCAACATAQPFTLTSGASVTTNITTLTTSGQYVKVSASALGQCLLLLLPRYLIVALQKPLSGRAVVLVHADSHTASLDLSELVSLHMHHPHHVQPTFCFIIYSKALLTHSVHASCRCCGYAFIAFLLHCSKPSTW